MAVSVETVINNVARTLLDTAFRTWSRAEHVANLNIEAGTSSLDDLIAQVENGVFIPSTLLALKLAEALGTKVEKLFALD